MGERSGDSDGGGDAKAGGSAGAESDAKAARGAKASGSARTGAKTGAGTDTRNGARIGRGAKAARGVKAGAVRTRYAPSPTGEQHIGGLRTALYNYLFAKRLGGAFVVRIEDTDRARFQPGAAERTLQTLTWIGIAPDESPTVGGAYGPYTQSERLSVYREHARRLTDDGAAYWAYDTDDELAELRLRGRGYDGRGRLRSEAENKRRRERGIGGVLRMITPADGASGWDDAILGAVSRNHSDIARDPVLLKSDGYPTYHLASVVDDHLMEISDVLRAQEWLSSTPLHLLLYRAFGWSPPRYAHLPLIVSANGKKLSKRDGATSVEQLRRMGFLSQALCNYVALLGWSYDGSREHFTIDDLRRLFDVRKIQKSAAAYDMHKLRWHNVRYLRQMPSGEFLRHIADVAGAQDVVAGDGAHDAAANADDGAKKTAGGPADANRYAGDFASDLTVDGAARLADALKERIHTAPEAPPWLRYLTAIDTPSPALLHGKKLTAPQAADVLRDLRTLPESDLTSVERVEERLRAVCQRRELPFGPAMGVVRVALSGEKSSLPAAVMLATLPAATVSVRIAGALRALKENEKTEG